MNAGTPTHLSAGGPNEMWNSRSFSPDAPSSGTRSVFANTGSVPFLNRPSVTKAEGVEEGEQLFVVWLRLDEHRVVAVREGVIKDRLQEELTVATPAVDVSHFERADLEELAGQSVLARDLLH